MNVSMTEEQAARYVRAALRLMAEQVPDGSGLARGLLSFEEELALDFPERQGACECSRTEQVYCHERGCQGGADLVEPDSVPVSRPWSQVAEEDWVRGGDGAYYLVIANRAENGKAYVTIQVRGKDNTYPREPGADVLVKRGPVGMAVDTIASAGFDLAVIASG